LKSWKSPNYLVGESFDLSGTLLDDHEVEDGKIVVDDAASDRLSLSLTSSAGSVARLALGEKELNSTDRADTLFHGEALLVVTASDSDNVSGPLGSEVISGDLLGHSLVVEVLKLLLVIDLEDLLAPGRGVGDVKFHFDASGSSIAHQKQDGSSIDQ